MRNILILSLLTGCGGMGLTTPTDQGDNPDADQPLADIQFADILPGFSDQAVAEDMAKPVDDMTAIIGADIFPADLTAINDFTSVFPDLTSPGPPDMTVAPQVDLFVSAGCSNMVMDGQETDVDCGGGMCNACALTKKCIKGSDCVSANCTNNVCVAPTCSDGARNGTETDVDCGGATCSRCANGKMCLGMNDCVSAFCANNICSTGPSCIDLVRNGNETDVDCGGGTCAKCVNGKMCLAGSDCASGICTNNICRPAPTCTDSIRNGNETDVDCGGGTCAKCGANRACLTGSDCFSGTCTNNKCVGGPLALSFAAQVFYATPTNAAFVAVGDTNSDGRVDVLAASAATSGGTVHQLLGNGDGTLKPATTLSGVGSGAIAVGDFNKDTFLDAVVPRYGAANTTVLLGNGNGSFNSSTITTTVSGFGALAADVNGDGHLDVVQSNYFSNNYSVLLGNGNGTFKPPATVAQPGATWAIARDLDGNGTLDLAISNFSSFGGAVEILSGNGDGTFKFTKSIPLLQAAVLAGADIDGNGTIDLVVPSETDGVYVILNTGSFNFATPMLYANAQSPSAVVLADFDLDGKLDFACSHLFGNTVGVRLGAGNGSFGALTTYTVGTNPFVLASTDLNADGRPDIVVGTQGTAGGVSVLINTSQ